MARLELSDLMRLSSGAMTGHPLRSLLSMLGIAIGDAAVITQLRALLRTDRSPAVRAEAVTRLARLDGIAALSDLTRALEDPAAPVRLAAVRAAATLDPGAVAALRSVAGNDSSDAARAAIAALSLMGREAHAVLTEMAAEHPDEGMRLLSRIAIGQPIGDRH